MDAAAVVAHFLGQRCEALGEMMVHGGSLANVPGHDFQDFGHAAIFMNAEGRFLVGQSPTPEREKRSPAHRGWGGGAGLSGRAKERTKLPPDTQATSLHGHRSLPQGDGVCRSLV